MTDEEKVAAVAAKLTGEKFYVGQRVRFKPLPNDGFKEHDGKEATVTAVLAGMLEVKPDPEPKVKGPWDATWWEPV